MREKMKEPMQQILEYPKNNDTITTMIGKEITGKPETQVRRIMETVSR